MESLHSTFHYFVQDSIQETRGVLEHAFLKQPELKFPLKPSIAQKIFNEHYRGTERDFLKALKEVPSRKEINCLTVILIHHGDEQGSFGGDVASLEPTEIFEALDCQTKPTLIICSACYAPSIFFMLDRQHKLVIRFPSNI